MLMAILVTVLAVTIANTIGSLFPRISNSYFEMAMGILIALTPALNRIIPQFNFKIFMLTLAPLLFFEGQTTTATTVTRNLRTIFSVAGILVLVSTLLIGGLLNLTTGLALSIGFILAVISAPTDATALEAISGGVKVPKKETELLRLEGLFNDASGLVLLEIAILFLHGNQIKLSTSLLSFLQAAGGGVIFGLLTGALAIILRQSIMGLSIDLSVAETMIFILSPFVIFLGAEALHFSGILAVVVAGIVGNGEIKHVRFVNPRQSRWGTDLVALCSELLNGSAFMSLGMLAARIIKTDLNVVTNSLRWLLLGTILYISSTLVRYLYIKLTTQKNYRMALVFAFGGVHGAVNFALTLSLLEYHLPLQTFELIVMAEVVFILLSMLIPTVVFKFLLPAEPAPRIEAEQLAKLKQAMVTDAVALVQKKELTPSIKKRVILDIQSQIQRPRLLDFLDRNKSTAHLTDAEQRTRQQTLRQIFAYERRYLLHQAELNQAITPLTNRLFNEVLLAESVAIDLTESIPDPG